MVAQSDLSLDASGSGAFNVQFPGGFNGKGLVKVYAYGSAEQSSGSVNFSTQNSFAQVTNFGITLDGNDFRVSIEGGASSTSTIDSLSFIGKVYQSKNRVADVPVVDLNIPLLAYGSSSYFGSTTIGEDSLKPGDVINGNLRAVSSDSTVFFSANVNYTVPGASDLSAFSRQGYTNVNSSVRVVADSIVELEAALYDWNSVPAQNVRVDFFDGPKSARQYIGSTRLSFDTAAVATARTPCSLSTGAHRIHMYLVFDSLSSGYDLNPLNNSAYGDVNVEFFVADSSGIVRIDSSAWLSGVASGHILRVGRVTPHLYPQPFIMRAKSVDSLSQCFQFLPVNGNPSSNLSVSIRVFNPDTATGSNLQALRIYVFDPRTSTINLVGGSYDGECVNAPIPQPGIFAVAYSTDHTPPQVTVSAGDQFFTNGDYVPPNPQFSFLIHDEDGVDLNRNNVRLELDGQPVDPSLIVVPDSVPNPTSVALTVRLPVKEGSHTLQAAAQDAGGNQSIPVSTDFVVRSDFSLRVYGAYPDPFVSNTFIAFEVTSPNQVEAVQVKIYSVSGRLVKTTRYPSGNPMEESGLLQGGTGSPTAVGYHEAWWDGTDNYGNQVANGVYFYRVTVTSGGKKLEEIGKMARLR